tara:strand:- start:7851 stop:8201 length:351 start_codon:yes stop_codon:yes gene_type:complete
MRYEELIRAVIGKPSKELKEMSQQEYDGAIGVSIMNSVKNGIAPNISTLAKAMSMPIRDIKPAFNRLSMNGMFLSHKWTMKLEELNTDHIKSDVNMKKKWCTVAATASGILGNVNT